MKTFILKLFCFMLIVSTALFIGTACKNEDDSNNDNDNAVSQGLEFERSSDYTAYAVAGVGDCFDTKIIIPSTYNDKPVVEIKEEAFKDYYLTSVTIPNSVTSIGKWAFMNCTNLTSVTMGNCVESIGYSAFYECINLTSITIPNSVTSIGGHAFDGCLKLVEVVNNSPYITVTKGSSDNGYLGCYAVSIFNSDDTYVNRFTTDTNGFVIYTNGNDKILVNYIGTNTNITIPSDITEIHKYAFCVNKNITSVTIPNSITSIGSYAFEGCTSLTSITIPNSVTSIGGWAFLNCNNLTSITYNGTKSKWNSISKEYNWNYNVPATYVTCTDGTVNIKN